MKRIWGTLACLLALTCAPSNAIVAMFDGFDGFDACGPAARTPTGG